MVAIYINLILNFLVSFRASQLTQNFAPLGIVLLVVVVVVVVVVIVIVVVVVVIVVIVVVFVE